VLEPNFSEFIFIHSTRVWEKKLACHHESCEQ
jgi:hypothetical protein